MRYECESLAQFYREISSVLLNGEKVCPRDLETRELIAPQIKINNPRRRLAYHKERGFNTAFAIVESLLLITHTNEVKYSAAINPNTAQFSDDGETFYGAYGYRVGRYIPYLIKKLRDDSDTRQAVLPIMRVEDLRAQTKDTPCTLALNFLIRDGKLNLITYMRSNDVIWGLPYDIYSFTTLQEVIANTLGLKLGYYIHCPTSLHVYKNHYGMLQLMGQAKSVEHVNTCDYSDWALLAVWYKRLVDTGQSDERYLSMRNRPFADRVLTKINENMVK